MPQDIVRLKGMAGKKVEEVSVTNESDFRNVSVRFTDKTALHFGFSIALSIAPELVDWKTGNGMECLFHALLELYVQAASAFSSVVVALPRINRLVRHYVHDFISPKSEIVGVHRGYTGVARRTVINLIE